MKPLREYLTLPFKRRLFLGVLAVVILLAVALGFRQAPVQVESAPVIRGPIMVTVEEEGRTRIPDRYEVSAPVSGYLTRIGLKPGDEVKRGSPLFSINPAQATPLDARSRAQAQASLARSKSALALAQSQVDSELARTKLAQLELGRIQRLVQSGHMPAANLDLAQTEARRAEASLRSSQFAVDVTRHEQDLARATLEAEGKTGTGLPITITSPINGLVLKRWRQSEGSVQAGDPLLTLGDLSSIDVEVDVLSPDAVRLRPGMRVELERWGGDKLLPGYVERIEPSGFTRFSALGVEEQRVWVIVNLDLDPAHLPPLGDAYRVQARFILWEGDKVLQVPSSALFREGDIWAAYLVNHNHAQRRVVKPGRRSGLVTEIIEGVNEGERVVLYPGQDVTDGARLELR